AEASERLGRMEDGDIGDARVGVDCEHLDSMRVAAACRVQLVGAERELAVCADWQVAPSPATRERDRCEERADGGAASIPARLRRHREGGVVGEHLGDRRHVSLIPCLEVALDEIAEAPVADGAQRRLLAACGEPLVRGLTGALQEAVDGGGGGAERRGDLGWCEPENVAEQEDRSLAARQVLEGGDEGQFDALAPLIAGLWRGGPVLDPEGVVGVGRQPNWLPQAPVGWAARALLGEVRAGRWRRRSRSAGPASAVARSS